MSPYDSVAHNVDEGVPSVAAVVWSLLTQFTHSTAIATVLLILAIIGLVLFGLIRTGWLRVSSSSDSDSVGVDIRNWYWRMARRFQSNPDENRPLIGATTAPTSTTSI